MTLHEIADFLECYNLWRRGSDDITQPDPKALGEVLDAVIAHLRGK